MGVCRYSRLPGPVSTYHCTLTFPGAGTCGGLGGRYPAMRATQKRGAWGRSGMPSLHRALGKKAKDPMDDVRGTGREGMFSTRPAGLAAVPLLLLPTPGPGAAASIFTARLTSPSARGPAPGLAAPAGSRREAIKLSSPGKHSGGGGVADD